MKNLYKAYYKDYFNDNVTFNLNKDGTLDVSCISDKVNDQFTRKCFWTDIPVPMDKLDTLQFKVNYPGLVTGIGINHEAGAKGEFKLGVHFDYTRGMPVVYGSSVKGVLRYWFSDFFKADRYERQAKNTQLSKREQEKLAETADKIKRIQMFLEEQESKSDKRNKDDFFLWQKLIERSDCSIYDRDIFFDAVLTKPASNGRILCSDSITPHPHPLKDPVPITFLKIASGCTMQFRFKLVNTVINDTLKFTAQEKLNLFKEILLTVGVGAKTNVGYGQFTQNPE